MIITTDFLKVHHFEFEMDQKWFISSIFGIFCFLDFSSFFYVTSYTLHNSGHTNNGVHSDALDSNRVNLPVDLWKNFGEANGNLTEQPLSGDAGESRKWLNVLAFDKLCNLTEKDKGPQNETKLIFINTEEHLKIFENDDEEEEDEDKVSNQLQEEREKNIFHLLSPEGFLSQIISEDQSNALERTKRQAEDGKRKCRCRRKRRRGMTRRRRRRRRRRNRTGQQRPARRRRRRRGRRRNGRGRGTRRCVCRKRGDGDGDGDGDGGDDEEGEGKAGGGEEPEVEGADGEEEGTTEGEEETTTEGDGEEGDEGEEEGGEGEGEGGEEGSNDGEEEEGSDEESDEEETDDEESAGKKPSPPEKEIPSAGGTPTYVIPYPNMVETPIFMMPSGGVPVGSYPTRIPTNKLPSYPVPGALLSGSINSNSNTEK